jgi:hypothetical protein
MPGLPVNRAAIKNALLARATAATFTTPINGFSTWAQPPSRRLRLFNQVDTAAQPACFLVQHRETYERRGTGHLVRRYLDMAFWCYAPTGDAAATSPIIGDDLLDLMEEALEAQLQPDDPVRNELTLGGLLPSGWCQIVRQDNMFIRDPGDLDGQALLVLPVRILLP